MSNIKIIDEELISLLKNGDETALKKIYSIYWEPLFLSAFNFLKDKETCEDIIQEVFINIWNRRDTILFSTSLKAYLYASVRYEVFRQIRAGNIRESVVENIAKHVFAVPASETLEHKELLQQINRIVETMPDKCKEVYKLSRVEQLSHKEIAEKLNISTKTVENHLTKALKILRSSLAQLVTLQLLMNLIR